MYSFIEIYEFSDLFPTPNLDGFQNVKISYETEVPVLP